MCRHPEKFFFWCPNNSGQQSAVNTPTANSEEKLIRPSQFKSSPFFFIIFTLLLWVWFGTIII